MTLDELRVDFIARRRGSLALPITGLIVYSAVALLTLVLPAEWHNRTLAILFWTIPPIGAAMMKLRGEESGSPAENPLFDLSAKARVMALSTWAIHIPVWIYAPALLPVTIGILFALHWMVFSWTVRHPVGIHHLAMRILFVLAAWRLFPENRVGAVSAGIALAYGLSVLQLRAIGWRTRFAGISPECAPEGARAWWAAQR